MRCCDVCVVVVVVVVFVACLSPTKGVFILAGVCGSALSGPSMCMHMCAARFCALCSTYTNTHADTDTHTHTYSRAGADAHRHRHIPRDFLEEKSVCVCCELGAHVSANS